MATQLADAGRVTVGAGEVKLGIDVTMQTGIAARIVGHVVADLIDAQVQKPKKLWLLQDARLSAIPPAFNVNVGGDGAFQTSPLPPGPYRLVAKLPPGADGRAAWTEGRFEIAGHDVTNVRLSLAPTAELRGRVMMDTLSAEKVSLSSIRIEVKRSDVGTVVSTVDVSATFADDSGMFRLASLIPGSYTLSVTAPEMAQGLLWAKSARNGTGRELLDTSFDVLTESVNDEIVVTMSTRPSKILGTLSGEGGQGNHGYLMVVFPVDPSWRPSPRRVRTDVVAADGTFSIEGVPEGEYFIGAVGVARANEVTPEVLDALSKVAHRITVKWGETAEVNLRLSGGTTR